MKKSVYSLLLTAFLLLSAFSGISVPAADAANSEYDFIAAIGELDRSITPETILTRGMFASMIRRVLYHGMDYGTGQNDTAFQDLSTSHPYYEDMYVLIKLNVISGDQNGRYFPDNPLIYTEAASMLVKALGYAPYAEAKGGYPSGYLAAAVDAGLNRNIKMPEKGIDGNIGAKLLYNALFADSVEIEGIGQNGISVAVNRNKNVLFSNLGIIEYDALLINDGFSSFDNSGSAGDNKIIVRELKNNQEISLTVCDNGILNYFGFRMRIYAKYNRTTGENEIVYYAPHRQTTSTILDADKIVEKNFSYIEYQPDENDDRYQTSCIVKRAKCENEIGFVLE